MQPEQDSFELKNYLKILFRWWWVLLIVPAITAGAAYYQANSQTAIYRATSGVLVQQARSGLIGPANLNANRELAVTYAGLARTPNLLGQALQELSLAHLPNVKASGVGPIIRISAEDSDPVVARDMANKLAELLILDIHSSQLRQITRLETLAESQGVSVSREILQARLSTIDSLRVIEEAVIPGVPFSPRPMRRGLLGGLLGLLIGGGIVFLLEYFNKTIRSAEQLEELVSTSNPASSNIGTISHWKSKEERSGLLMVLNDPGSIYAEMFRQLRTGFEFVRAVQRTKAFLITSAVPREGKSTIAANLAVVLAQGGKRVILVDGDLRRPYIHRIFNLPEPDSENNYQGLSGLLIDYDRPASKELVDVGIPGLKVVISGQVPPNPTDLLASHRCKAVIDELKEQCDVLLVDSVPATATADPAVLAGYVDGVIMIVAMGEAQPDAVRSAVAQIQRAGTPVVGYVMNKVRSRQLGYSPHRYYYHPRREHWETNHTNGAKHGHSTNGTGSVLSGALDRVKNPLGRKK